MMHSCAIRGMIVAAASRGEGCEAMQEERGGGRGWEDGAKGVLRPAVAMAPREALATIAEIAGAYADEAALAGLSLRVVAMVMAVIADTARLAVPERTGGPS
jgi:hypothetical protein